MNKGMVAASLSNFVFTPGFKKVFAAFDGPMPDRATLESLYTGTELKLNQLTALGASNLRGHFVYGEDFVADKIRNNMIRWQTSQRDEPITITAIGPVTWFYFAIVDSTATSPQSNVDVMHAYVGDITDIYEGGGMEIIDGVLGANQNYLLNDIEILFKV
tara:strand:+ start:390 stop:869 length:480 start_codon:yes stop_codon:yes gene_type:complete